ncbi:MULTISPECIES: hypothetical protein [unclassified Pseudomonas]|uniref:hypothetical protein n=1 Tax=unclassified Pseudomonas TaxID=196821 RepID=UPI000D372B0D|nr:MULTISPECIES: hypothetical protein [unclassified Pseudomonas]RAU43686.1 hypothetical protein DBP26_019350 [Pseudomonas sp. RIT 409]RAU54382.1 hypothetical protein DBY65_008620 [Pseudomonas sp. RIT 412]
MGNVIDFDVAAGITRDNKPAHIDEYGQVMLIGVFGDLVKLRDNAANEQSRKQVDAIVKQLGALLSRYEPDGAA